MRTWLLVSVLFAASCSFAKANPEYCERNDQCLTTGSFCDPLRHRCTQPPAELQLTAVEPPTGLASGGTSITLRGQNFKSGMSVLINGVPTGATFVSAAGDSATTVAPFSNGVCGPVRVRVTNLDGESVENAAAFRYRFGNVNFTPSASTTIYTAAAAVGGVARDVAGRLLSVRPGGNGLPGVTLGEGREERSARRDARCQRGRLLGGDRPSVQRS